MSTYQGGSESKDERTYLRTFSWFGLGATEAAAKHQGITLEDGTSIGASKGYGILEQFWNWLKSAFWFGIFFFGILVVLCFVPATAGIARMILRWFASLIPVIGSGIEWAVSKAKLAKNEMIQKNIVESVQAGRETLKKEDPKAAEKLDATLKEFQDQETKKAIKLLKS